jgi:lipid II:glycine glycyltransferase (peptidoglycan interpeptide bridge formation enzyme)
MINEKKFFIEMDIFKIPKEDIESFLAQSKHGNVFHSLYMYKFFRKLKKWESFFFGVRDLNNKLQAVLLCVLQREKAGLLEYFTSRAIVFAGPVINDNLDEQDKIIVLELLLQELIKVVENKSIYIHFRNLFSLEQYQSSFEKFGFEYHKHLNFRVDTTDEKDLNSRISKSKKRQIKKSIKTGAKIIEPQNIEQVKEFYSLIKDLYKKKVKKPLPDWKFFKYFYEASNNNKLGKYFLIEYQENIIGGIMCPITPGKVIYEWYICGLDGQFKGIYPSVLATWAAIDYASQNGFEYFDFMGAGKPDQDYGVREFKSKFGGKLVDFGRFEKINNKFLYNIGKLGIKVLGKLK